MENALKMEVLNGSPPCQSRPKEASMSSVGSRRVMVMLDGVLLALMVKGLAATLSRSVRRLRIDLVRERDTTLHHLGLRKVYIGDSFSRLVGTFCL